LKKILIVNDDGIEADGIIRLAAAAKKFGEVWVIAPDSQRSAMSHCITLRDSMDVFPVDFPIEEVHAFATTGTPADCVRFGILNIMETKPDIVFSGINFGYNSGCDIQYSATVGAAMEAATSKIPAIAFSEGFNGCHEVTDAYLESIIEELIDRAPGDNRIWNVNFPECKLSELKGILRDRTVARNGFYIDHYNEEPLPNGGMRLRVEGVYQEEAAEGTDFRALVDHYISIGVVNNLK